ncbi:MAG: sigma-70 family RNA polymerase sigma factor [Gemmataceae bacterium]
MAVTLLERIARGDRDAVPECLAAYGGLVWALARKQTTDPSDAEDAVQEIFVDLWRHAGRFDSKIASESTFVAMIARRRLLDRSRKRGRSLPTTPLPDDGGPVYSPNEERLAIADEVAVVRARMTEISAEQRRVLELAIDKGMSQADISNALGMPLGTVKAHARRGLLRLREMLTGQVDEAVAKGDVP